jgi:hypothetical protein
LLLCAFPLFGTSVCRLFFVIQTLIHSVGESFYSSAILSPLPIRYVLCVHNTCTSIAF